MLTISSSNIQELLVYLKGDNPTLSIYSTVIYKHDKKTNGKEIKTTFGKVLFNALLPEDYPFINEPVNRSKLKEILLDVLNKYGKDTYDKTVHNIQKYALLFSAIAPATIELTKLELPEEIKKMKEELIKKADKLDPVEFDKEVDKIYSELEKYLKDATFFDMVRSGTKGKKTDLEQLFIAWGPAFDPLYDEGSSLIIKNSLLEGLSPEDLYIGANKARYAAYLKSEFSAQPGYSSRKMRFALNTVKFSKLEDCKTNNYFEIKVDKSISKLILGRYYYDEKTKKILKITPENVKNLINKVIKLRSPLYCKAEDGICKVCYGDLAKLTKTEVPGLNASSSLYVVLLNKYMKISHGKISAQEEVDFEKEFEKFYA